MTREQAITMLKQCQLHGYENIEEGHAIADRVLVNLLDDLGYQDVTEEFRKVPKCYA